MSKAPPSTSVHRAPAQPLGVRRRPMWVSAYPRSVAFRLPDSGRHVGRAWLQEEGLEDSEVSSAHLRIDRAGGGIRVADVGSRNGTWVNGVPIARDELVSLDDGAVVRLGRTLLVLRDSFHGSETPAEPVGDMVGPYGLREVQLAIDGLAASGQASNVLIDGETGTGKELTARAVAAALGRDTPFAAVNVAGVATGVFESQMFGHVAGAFSGAGEAAPGIAVAHHGGTLFLDEIGELDWTLQAKLLRLLDNREVMPVGATRARPVDVLVIAATNRDLGAMVEAGTFRRDLHARLSMATISLPPLRMRREDIFEVAAAMAKRQGRVLVADTVEVEAMERLLLEPWPSNVRQLDATLAAVARCDPDPGLRLWALEQVLGTRDTAAATLTREVAMRAIEAAGGNVSAAAKVLGVSRGKLLRLRKS